MGPGAPIILDCCDKDNCNARDAECNLELLMNQFMLCEKLADALYGAPKDKIKDLINKGLPPCKALDYADKFCQVTDLISGVDSLGKFGDFLEPINKACDFRADFTCG